MLKRKFNVLQICAMILLLALSQAGCEKSNNENKFGELSTLASGKTDKCMEAHGFTEIYEHILFPLRDLKIRICEIGIAGGGSLVLWQEYFKNSTVYAIDIDEYAKLNSQRVKTFVADQANRDQLQSFIDKYDGDFDFILDDGGHSMEQQQVSFGFLFKHVKPGGYYIIEDVQTSLPYYYGGFGVNEDENNTSLKMINNFVKSAHIKSQYLTSEEEEYLDNHIEYCNLFFRNGIGHSIACVFKKADSDKPVGSTMKKF
ncbi:MAG: class I SAM-dependent methyltransferase [Candidatus Electryonea clarkiae]|nr:class I SAM-dependent methyltransferase [Candidatus Electryonea clarkiae]MDP8287931.1 class I SAM-dependent methyltransferase [Candidatus Electryonea clarkiae]